MAVDLANLAFTSNLRYEYIATKGHTGFSVTTTFPNAVITYSIPHNLGYAPFFKMFYTFDNSVFYPLFTGPASYNLAGNGFQMDNAYADINNVYFTADNSTGSGTITGTVYYRIYAEPQAA